MALLTSDFLKNRAKFRQYKKFALPVLLLLVLLSYAAAGGFYLFKNHRSVKVAAVCGESSGRLPVDWLLQNFGTCNEASDRVGGPDGDPDEDILTNVQEFHFGTHPANADTDGDSLPDGAEIAFGQNPLGEGELAISTQSAEEYLKELGPEYQDFSMENIQKEVEELFNPKQAVLLQLPDDKELVITDQNDVPAIEKYYNDTMGIMAGDPADKEKLETALFEMSAAEIEAYLGKLQATLKVLKETPVPSEIVNIQKFKVAQIAAGIRMVELVRNNYQPDEENKQFWSDFFGQIVAAQQASEFELLAWGELGKKLQDEGGLPDE